MVIKSQKGSALVMALLIGLLGTVIGTTLYHVSSTNATQVQKIEDQLQADYYAESGVNLALGIISKHYDDDAYFANTRYYCGTLEALSEYVAGSELNGNYTIDLSIQKETDADGKVNYAINSTGITRRGSTQGTGQSSSQSRSDAKYLISNDVFEQIANNEQNGTSIVQTKRSGVFANNSIALEKDALITGDTTINSKSFDSLSFSTKPSIDGDLYYLGNGTDDNNFLALETNDYVTGSVEPADSYPAYVLPSFPTVTAQASDLDLNKQSFSLPLTGNFFDFKSITVGKKSCLNINLNNNRNIVIVTNSLVVDGSGINVIGNGTLTIYVNDSCSLGLSNSSDKTAINSDGKPMQIISKGNIYINCDLWSNIYAPKSKLAIGKKGNVNGAVIANDIAIEGNNGGGNGNASINAGAYKMTVWNEAAGTGNIIYSGEYEYK